MVLREVEESAHERLEMLIAAEFALQLEGKTIYDLPRSERAQIHPKYSEAGSHLSWDMEQLEKLGLLERKARWQRSFDKWYGKIEDAIKSGTDVFSMGRKRLALHLGTELSVLELYWKELVEKLENKYGRIPAFAKSQHDGHVREETMAAYETISRGSGQLLPSAMELAEKLGIPRTTATTRCIIYGLPIDKSRIKVLTKARWRKILHLEEKLEKQGECILFLANRELSEYFSNFPVPRLKYELGRMLARNYLSWPRFGNEEVPRNWVRLYIVQKNLATDINYINALKEARWSLQTYNSELNSAKQRLDELTKTGGALSQEAKFLRKILNLAVGSSKNLGKPIKAGPA